MRTDVLPESPAALRQGHTRWLVLAVLFTATTLFYADRATLSIAGNVMGGDLKLGKVALGYIFSAFSWSYVIAQIPGGWFLDRFGSKRVYAWSIILCALLNILTGFVGVFSAGAAVTALFVLRFLSGLAQAPSFPGNSRIVAAWFPSKERGTASAVYSSAQYFATVAFAPVVGWMTSVWGWKAIFLVIGILGLILALVWKRMIHAPGSHPRMTPSELEYLDKGGALIHLDATATAKQPAGPISRHPMKKLLTNRMLLGIYIGQYFITTLTTFFLTWFPVYLVQERGMSLVKAGFAATLPALCGFLGAILGGVVSDALLRSGRSLSAARKVPIVAGLLLSMSVLACTRIDSNAWILFFMSLSYFGKGFGAQGWAVVSDTSPKEIAGQSGGLFNTFGNAAGITTPIIIGYILETTGSFQGAMIFVGASGLIAILSYVFLVGEIKRVDWTD